MSSSGLAGSAKAAHSHTGDTEGPPHTLERGYSVRSQETVDTLQQIEEELTEMKAKSDSADELIRLPPSDGLPLHLRNTLAQLHGKANQILATRIDAIVTSQSAAYASLG